MMLAKRSWVENSSSASVEQQQDRQDDIAFSRNDRPFKHIIVRYWQVLTRQALYGRIKPVEHLIGYLGRDFTGAPVLALERVLNLTCNERCV
jgi:hypothetical protein